MEDEDEVIQRPFCTDRSVKLAKCKKCTLPIEKASLRIAKYIPNNFGGEGLAKQWYHVPCIFDQFTRQRANTAKITSTDDIDGWSEIEDEDRKEILKHLPGVSDDPNRPFQKKTPNKKTKAKKRNAESKINTTIAKQNFNIKNDPKHEDNSFRRFRKICFSLEKTTSHIDKSQLLKEWFTSGSDGEQFCGDLLLWLQFLLPGDILRRVYHINEQVLAKCLARALQVNEDQFIRDYKQSGDISETAREYHEKHLDSSTGKGKLSMHDIDNWLQELATINKEVDKVEHIKTLAKKATSNELKTVFRLVLKNLGIDAGPKIILDAVHPNAYNSWRTTNDIQSVLQQITSGQGAGILVGTPIRPMLAEPCRNWAQPFDKFPDGLYAEIKYDGERVQVHKNLSGPIQYFSRSLKIVKHDKVAPFDDLLNKAFPIASSYILDAEVLVVDKDSGDHLPFGTLGIHKRAEHKNAQLCLFVFDILFFEGISLIDKPLSERRKLLMAKMQVIPHCLELSEIHKINKLETLQKIAKATFAKELEGLMLKNPDGKYEPGRRRWLKVKKDHLNKGELADTADLLILGAWFGNGRYGGKLSSFLLGCSNNGSDWLTVTKAHSGLDDATIYALTDELKPKMKLTKGNRASIPNWIDLPSQLAVPDYIALDYKDMLVWEIQGTQFTTQDTNHSSGISLRFPRMVRPRPDKDHSTATTLKELRELVNKSSEDINLNLTNSFDSSAEPKTNNTKRNNNNNSPRTPKKKKVDSLNYDIQQIIPQIFKGFKVVVADSRKRLDKDVYRKFYGYGGDVIPLADVNEATHVLHINNSSVEDNKWPSTVRHVTMDWLTECVKNKRILNSLPYALTHSRSTSID